MHTDCVFCKIVGKKIPTKIVKETEDLLVFNDINPKAPVHLLIVSKEHFKDLKNVTDKVWIGIRKVAQELAKEKKLSGFRLVTNVGDAAEIPHMHVHFLGEVTLEREI